MPQAWGGGQWESLFVLPALTGFKWWAWLANPQQRKVLRPTSVRGGRVWVCAQDGLSAVGQRREGQAQEGRAHLGWDRGGVWERREREVPVARLWSSTQGCGERGNRVCLIPLRKCFYFFNVSFVWQVRSCVLILRCKKLECLCWSWKAQTCKSEGKLHLGWKNGILCSFLPCFSTVFSLIQINVFLFLSHATVHSRTLGFRTSV